MRAAKILVIGAPEAGKSTLIRLMCESAINIEHRGRTVSLDHGVLRSERLAVSLIGVPGQERFAAVREALADRAAAAIWVHAAGAEIDMGAAELLFHLGPGVPYVVLVNQRDGVGSPRFDVPDLLGRPVAVITGDLVRDARTRERLLAVVPGLLSVERP